MGISAVARWAVMKSRGLNSMEPAGTRSPYWAMAANSPIVPRLAVFPPMFGPVIRVTPEAISKERGVYLRPVSRTSSSTRRCLPESMRRAESVQSLGLTPLISAENLALASRKSR